VVVDVQQMADESIHLIIQEIIQTTVTVNGLSVYHEARSYLFVSSPLTLKVRTNTSLPFPSLPFPSLPYGSQWQRCQLKNMNSRKISVLFIISVALGETDVPDDMRLLNFSRQ
jgi:hypothetical protein